ncbi:MAG: hypothetical protein GY853_01080, partial [PVC group bacterium]|nr:hypothetical protein [PVC group bacterium]
MASVIAQWSNDYADKFKTLFPTTFSNLQIYPSSPIGWVNKINIPFGNKIFQRNIRTPDQRIQIAKEVEYKDKDATRVPQKVDMPALFDSLRIPEEDYAADVANAVGHVSDLFENFQDGLANFVYTGTAVAPLTYGLLDAGAGTGSTTVARPDKITDVTTTGKWDVQAAMFEDIGTAEANLINKGFFGPKRLLMPTIIKPMLSHVMTSTRTPYRDWIHDIAGYPITFTDLVDPDAALTAFDVVMVDENAFDLATTPLKVRGFFDNNTEDFVWHWKTRAYLVARPKHDGTDWQKGVCKIAQVDW